MNATAPWRENASEAVDISRNAAWASASNCLGAANNRASLVTTKSGLTIGCAYIKPAPSQSRDAEVIQSALLGQEAGPFERALDLFNRYTPHVLVVVIVVGVLIGLSRPLWRAL